MEWFHAAHILKVNMVARAGNWTTFGTPGSADGYTGFQIQGGAVLSNTGSTTYYLMRGYYLAGAVYETWVVTTTPGSTPPSGHVLTNVTIVATWTS